MKKSKLARLFRKTTAYLLVFCLVNQPLWALNAGDAAVTAGTANISTPAANTVQVDLITRRAVLDWTQMNATSGETLKFQSAQSDFAALNRVNSMVNFNGTLDAAGGRVYILSRHGVNIGPEANIVASAFTASGLDMTNEDFMNGVDKFQPFAGGAIGDVTNQAVITNVTDQVAFLGKTVLNEGTIQLPSGGVAVMAAGESVWLGAPGSKVIIEMKGVEGGSVTNAGAISAPDGKIVLAAGDIYSIPLHPQLKVNAGAAEAPVYNVNDQPVRAESGNGTVTQSGTLQADGGEVTLTAGDAVNLESGSSTSALNGIVAAYAHDFDDSAATTSFKAGASVSIGTGEAVFHGNLILYGGTLNASSGAVVHIESKNLTIADVMNPGTMDTIQEETVESYSTRGINIDLAADEMITVEYMADGKIFGRSGDILLRNVYDTGGILFESNASGKRTTMQTTASPGTLGGDIFMIAGSGGIVTGDINTDVLPSDPEGSAGRIRLMTTNGGDIETGTLSATRGNDTEVSAIAAGRLTVRGDIFSKNHQVPQNDQTINFARLCLVAMDDIYIDAERGVIEVHAHGKIKATADIIICAGKNITIENLSGDISVYAQTSENSAVQNSTASIKLGAGGNMEGPGVITINGNVYDSSTDYSGLPAIAAARVSGHGSTLEITPSGAPAGGEKGEVIWNDSKSNPGEYLVDVYLRIHNNEQIVPGAPGSICAECEVPEGLPPVPVIFWLMDDQFDTNWRSGNVPGFDPEELDVLLNDGIKFDAAIVNITDTTRGGTVKTVQFVDPETGQKYYGFKYTPSTTEKFIWDGVSSDSDGYFAYFIDTFTYQATQEVNGTTHTSQNSATVQIVVKNYLPQLSPDSQTIHMATASNQTSADFDFSSMVIDPDGTPGTMQYGIVPGTIPVGTGSVGTGSTLTIDDDSITFSPWEGYVSPAGSPVSFGYTVSDSSILNTMGDAAVQDAALSVTVTNTLPGGDVWLGTTQMDTPIENGSIVSGSFSDDDDPILGVEAITPSYDDYNEGWGGSLTNDESGFDYDPTAMGLPGYTGDKVDNFDDPGYDPSVNADDRFDVKLWDGQYEYALDGDIEDGWELWSPDGGATTLYRKAVYGTGTVSVDIVNTPPGGDAWFGQVHMDSQNVTGDLQIGFDDDVTVESGTYTGSVIGSGLYGGTLVFDGDTWTYSTDTDLPGYIGDDQDQFGQDGYVADDLFIVNLFNGEYDYWFGEGEIPDGYESFAEGDIHRKAVLSEGTVSVDITNTLPTVNDDSAIAHMDISIQRPLSISDPDADALTLQNTASASGVGSVTLNTSDGYSYTYDPAAGYVGPDSFTFTVSDGQRNYVFAADGSIVSNELVTVTGTVNLEMTNALPTADGFLGEVGETPASIPQIGETPVQVVDGFDPYQPEGYFDTLSIVSDTYYGDHGGVLVFNGSEWIYTPAEGFSGVETFSIKVWDGQNIYEDGRLVGPQYGDGTVTVERTIRPPILPVAPLQDLQIPQLSGCPALMEVAAAELTINADELQMLMGSSLASNPSLQPCDACEQLVNAARILNDPDGLRMAAMNEIFNTMAPSNAPFTPEVSASIATAFANIEPGDENYRQFALAQEYADAFVAYVAVISTQFKVPGDPVAMVMSKYGTTVLENENPNIGTFILSQMQQQ